MSPVARPILLLLLVAALAGCTSLSPRTEPGSQLDRYQQQLQQGRYGEAQRLIATTPKGHPDYAVLQRRLPQLNSTIRRFERESISAALTLERSHNWQGAEERFEEALERLPESQSLEKGRLAMAQRRQQRIDALHREQLIIKGEWVKQEQPLRKGLLETAPNNLLRQWDKRRITSEAEGLSEELSEIGVAALDRGELALALRTLPLALQLDASQQSRSAHARLKKMLEKRNQAEALAAERALRDRQRGWLEQFNRAIAAGDLHRAQELFDKLNGEPPAPKNIALLEEQLTLAIGNHIEQELQVGDIYYRSGDYELARDTWEQVLALRPDNEVAIAKLERVNRVIHKLRELRERQLPETPAGTADRR